MSEAGTTLRNWRVLLFTEGRGWLRWGFGTCEWTDVIDEFGGPTEYFSCAPPLRRGWLWLRSRIGWLLRAGGWVRWWEGSWKRFRWEDYVTRPSDLAELCDPRWPDRYINR